MAGDDDQSEYSELSEEDLCFRGLEVLGACEERAILRLKRRQQAQDAVWDAQDAIWDAPACTRSGLSEEDIIIAAAYRTISVESQRDAHLQGMQYREENEREEFEISISGLGSWSKSAVRRVVGGSTRNLGKKTGSIRNLGKKDSTRNCTPPTRKQVTSQAA
jgi:hypothetical protein